MYSPECIIHIVIPEYVTVRVFPGSTQSVFPLLQCTDLIPLANTAEGVKIRMLVNCPSVLLVKFAVNPIAAEECSTGSVEENEILGASGGQTPDCNAVDHISLSPVVTTQVHILGLLSLGHSP